ncbi:hypothetical protein [Paenibacillus sp. 481]|uniref:hypothetical protein n=1 Tax=Paenibacillus sp. 481 TaxID=2835869 RepID=UPI001E3B8402|nr:hypothetical protein [Paenibacillus sp. 481]UHA72132.1 hypothetical protein KIK04_15660 [Paenibacillus sp. 481]
MKMHTILDQYEWGKLIADDSNYVIAHLLDKVLIGKVAELEDKKRVAFEKALENKTLLEAHFFNERREVFVGRHDQQLVVYAPLEHTNGSEDSEPPVVLRSYAVEQNCNANGYKFLEVKEYFNYDEESHLAYVEKTVLYRLVKG